MRCAHDNDALALNSRPMMDNACDATDNFRLHFFPVVVSGLKMSMGDWSQWLKE